MAKIEGLTANMINTNQLDYAVCKTVSGWLAVVASPKGLTRLVLPRATAAEAAALLGINLPESRQSNSRFANLFERLQGYFHGQLAEFSDDLDLKGGSAFDKLVWLAVREIPFGSTRSYGWVAERVGNPRASRAVGGALGRNPLPIIIPCHRVLAADGSLHGFSDGLEMKRLMLRLEGVTAK
jgi:O-6-methylguanine DNA methyltransferase